MSKPIIHYPPGLTPKDELDNSKEEPSRGTVRFPSKQFRVDFVYVCRKAGFSANEVLVAYATEFMRKNCFLLEQKKKK